MWTDCCLTVLPSSPSLLCCPLNLWAHPLPVKQEDRQQHRKSTSKQKTHDAISLAAPHFGIRCDQMCMSLCPRANTFQNSSKMGQIVNQCLSHEHSRQVNAHIVLLQHKKSWSWLWPKSGRARFPIMSCIDADLSVTMLTPFALLKASTLGPKHQNWTVEQWVKGSSDVSCFELHHSCSVCVVYLQRWKQLP